MTPISLGPSLNFVRIKDKPRLWNYIFCKLLDLVHSYSLLVDLPDYIVFSVFFKLIPVACQLLPAIKHPLHRHLRDVNIFKLRDQYIVVVLTRGQVPEFIQKNQKAISSQFVGLIRENIIS